MEPGSDSLLRDIAARPRPVGSDALAGARERCARELRALGFDVAERPFAFSSFPGRYATPLIGGAAAALVGYAGKQAVAGSRLIPLLALGAGVVVLALAGRWLATRGVLDAPLLRERGVNLEATRGGRAAVWLCAHLDSKSQPIPTVVRSAGITIEAAGVLLALGLSIATATGVRVHPIYWVMTSVLALAGAIPVVLSWVGTRSPGAFDNASGVATVLAAAALVKDVSSIGVLLTDAEELGLAGARAWSREKGGGTVLNCDGIDDDGGIAVMYAASWPGGVLRAVSSASRTTGVPHEAMRLIPGVLTDSVAFAGAGMPSVTFSRGSVASLLRVHSPRDSLAQLRGTGIAEAAKLIAATARAIAQGDVR